MSPFQAAAIAGAVVLALALISWLLLCLRTRRWRAAALEGLARARHSLEGARRMLRASEQQAFAFPADLPPPYGPLSSALHRTLRQARAHYTAAAARCAELGRRAQPAAQSGLSGPLFDLLCLGLEVRQWRTSSARGEALAAATSALEEALARAQNQLAALRDMPRAQLRRSQDLHQTYKRIQELLPELDAAGLSGQTLDQAAAQSQDLYTSLAGLPPWCVPSQEMARLDEVTLDSTAAAWQILEQVEAPLCAILNQLEGWLAAYRLAGTALSKMQQALQAAGDRLQRLPVQVDAGAETQRLARLGEQGTALETRYQAPRIEDLASLQARIHELTGAADALATAAETAERAYIYLGQAIPGNTLQLHGLANRMNEAMYALPCPLDWEGQLERLQQLRRIENEIGPVEIRRTPARLKGHADMAAQLAEDLEALERQVLEALRLRDEWVELTGRPEMALPLIWLQQAQELHQQAGKYGPLNWPRGIDATRILHTARDLEAQYRRLMPPAPGMRLGVSSIPAYLERLKDLAAQIDDLGQDLRLAQERLATLQATERQAGEEIGRVDEVLEDLLEEGERAQPPFAGAAGRWRALRQAYRGGDRLAARLEGRQRRRVEDQARLVQAWVAEIHHLLAAWVEAGQGEVEDMVAGLRQEVAALDAVAPFNREPAMADAQAELNSRSQTSRRPSGHRARDLPPMEELAEQGARLLASRARLHAIREALRTQIAGRVHPEHKRLEQAQHEAQERVEALLELQQACRAEWPPLLCDTRSIAREWEQIQREQARLRSMGGTVRDVVYELQRLAERCQALTGEARQLEEQTGDQRQELQKQVARLDDWQQRLADYRRAHHDERAVTEAVGERIREIETLIRRAQDRYRRSELTVQEARRVLDDLWSAAHADLPVRGQTTPLSAAAIESR